MHLNSRRNILVDKAKKHLWIVCWSVIFWDFAYPAFAQDDISRVYSIQADFRNIDKKKFPIQMDASITNHTKTSLSELMWMIYPNRFLKPLPNLNDLNYRRIYPNGFSPGSIQINSLTQDGEDLSQKFESISLPPIPEQTLFLLKLDKPMAPGESRTFHFSMILNVPRKFGSFGYYDKRLTMSGGWTPYLVSFRDGSFQPGDQSPKAKWEVKINSNATVVAGSDIIRPGASEKTIIRENIGQFSMQIGTYLKTDSIDEGEFHLQTVVNEGNPEKIIAPLKNIFGPWVDYVNELGADKLLASKNITFVQAPLREMLAVDGQDMSFFSDRAYKVIRDLHQFHSVPLVKILFSQTIYPQILKKENAQNYYWVNEVVSTQLTEDFIQTQHYKTRDARNLGVMRIFSVLPIIDQIIHTPQFAFFDVFYNFSYPYDPVRDEFVRFQNRRQYGKSIIAHMVDELGEKAVHDIVNAYVTSPDQNFLQISENYTGKKLQDRFDHWTAQRPVLNYKLGRIKSKKNENGYTNTVRVEKESNRPIEEPVEIRVVEKNGKSLTEVWNSKEAEHTFTFDTTSKIKSIEVDPRQRLLETKLSDNRRPPYWKFVLTEFFWEYDVTANQPLVYVQSQLRKKYGGQDRYNLGGFYQADSYGTNVGYTRLFGRPLDTLRTSHGVGLQYGFSRLTPDDVFVDADPDEIVRVTDSGFLSTVTASYFFGNQLSFTNPLQGHYGGVGVTYGSSYLGGNFDYYAASVSGSKIFMLHPSHLLAFRGIFGFSGPDDMPSQVQYRLGGISSMRGLSVSDETYIGRNLLLFSGEYRHFLIQDIDINLWLFRVRDVQGALFSDAGQVTDTVQERADESVFGPTSPTTSLGDLFDVTNFETDMGYGLRFFVDYFGVSPGLIRFDLAKSLSDNEQSYRFYFGATQSF